MRAPSPAHTLPVLPLLAAAYAGGAAAAGAVVTTAGVDAWQMPALTAVLVAAALVVRGAATPLIVTAALALAGTAFVRHESSLDGPPAAIAELRGVHAFEVSVRSDPVARGRFARLEGDVRAIDGRPAEGALRLTILLGDEPPREGDRIAFRGETEPLDDALRDGDSQDYARFLRSRGIDATIAFPERLEVVAHDEGGSVVRGLWALRRHLVENIERSLPEPESSLAVGMLLGRQGTLPTELAANLRATGTTHLVVVSGQNIALVLSTLASVLAVALSRRTAALAALGVLPGYVLLVGAEPPVVRAAIMAVGVTVGQLTGRRTPGWVFLLYAVAAMLALEPALIESVSFQLSASATWGVIVLAPLLRDLVSRALRVPDSGLAFALVEVTATATAALAAVLPVQAAVFGSLPLAAIPANVLAAPMYEATLLIAALAAVFGEFDVVADVLWVAGTAAPRLFVDMVALFARAGAASLPASEPVLLAVGWYAVLGAFTALAGRRVPDGLDARGGGSALAPAVLAIVVFGVWSAGGAASASPSVAVLDVGQGLAVLVRDGASSVLIDAGPPDGAVLRALPRGSPRTLDALVVTHGDLDHAGGGAEARRRLRVDRVLGNAREREHPEPLHVGDRVHVGRNSWIEVLSPPDTPIRPRESENDRSLVLLVGLDARRVLVAADIEALAEQWLVNSGRDLRADALVVPHHGSRTSSTPAFIEAVAPTVAVVSAGASNQFGHPHPEVVRRYEAAGIRLLNTAERGSVTLVARSDGLDVTTAL